MRDHLAKAAAKAYNCAMSSNVVPRSQRQAKGVNLISLVKLLHTQKDAWKDHPLRDSARALMQQRITYTGWYPFTDFEELLKLAHQVLFGGSDQAALQMGVTGGKLIFGDVHKAYIAPGDPDRTLGGLIRAWPGYFNFAKPQRQVEGDTARVQILEYPDISKVHGLIMLGWAQAMLKLSGTSKVQHKIISAPWLGSGDFEFELSWS